MKLYGISRRLPPREWHDTFSSLQDAWEHVRWMAERDTRGARPGDVIDVRRLDETGGMMNAVLSIRVVGVGDRAMTERYMGATVEYIYPQMTVPTMTRRSTVGDLPSPPLLLDDARPRERVL